MAEDLSLEAQIRRLADIEAIKTVKYKYFRLVDAHQFEEWGRECLAQDCVLTTTEIGTHRGRDAIAAAVRKSYGSCKTMHHAHMPEITFTSDDTASVLWAMDDVTRWTANGVETVDWGRGRYEEDYVREGGRWLISRTSLIRQSLPAPKNTPAMA